MMFVSCQSYAEIDPEIDTAMNKIRTYCQSCHGVGELRFIQNESNLRLWDDINNTESPKSKRLWRELILEVLDWPTNSPPSFGDLMTPPDKDWMPKGAKRLKIVKETVNGMDAREFIHYVLSEAQ